MSESSRNNLAHHWRRFQIFTWFHTKLFVNQNKQETISPVGIYPDFWLYSCTPNDTCQDIVKYLWEKICWGEAVSTEISVEWYIWCHEVRERSTITFPRFIFNLINRTKSSYEVHVHKLTAQFFFYLCTLDPNANVETCCEQKPIKRLPLPRLELLGALIGSRLNQYVKKTCQDKDLWTDLKWIHGSDSRGNTFVANRVIETQRNTDASRWKFFPRKNNSADLLTQGILARNLQTSKLWWDAPSWLKSRSEWPVYKRKYYVSESADV